MIVARISAQRTCFERDHNGRAWLAWHIAALMRSNPKKPLPKLETMLALAPSVRRQQTPNEILAMVKMLNAAFGGTVKG